jgi:hypothetical protein
MRYPMILGMIATLAVSIASVATAGQCSIHPPKGATDAQLAALAKVTKADAEKTAIGSVKSAATATDAELEAEHGCLIWSFDVKVEGKSGVKEVHVDAGNGKVLSTKHESAEHEAAEAKQEAAKAKKP